MPRVSVCVTSYNHERYIGECLDSVLAQVGDFELEVLVGDDVSHDGTRDVVTEYARRHPDIIVPVFHEKNLGASGNLQALMGLASGEFIAHLDGDDIWAPDKLQKQLQRLQARPSAVAAYCNARVLGLDGQFMGCFNDVVPSPFGLDYLVRCGNFLNNSSLLYRSSARETLQALRGDFIDYRVHIHLASLGELLFVDEPLVTYRWMVGNSMTSTSRDPIFEQYLDAVEDAQRLGASEDALNDCLQRMCRSIIYSALLPPNPRRVTKFYRLLRASPTLSPRRRQLSWYLFMACLQFPLVAFRHIRGAFTREKIFFPTAHHSA